MEFIDSELEGKWLGFEVFEKSLEKSFRTKPFNFGSWFEFLNLNWFFILDRLEFGLIWSLD